MDDTKGVHAPARNASRVPVTFRLRSDLVRLVESIAERTGRTRNDVLEEWAESKLEDAYPGCTGVAA